ncbi:RNA polymerase sigma-70 factor, ECF subfamily [Chitinophaga costaii]|uniref:RNA polymerase sigma-70 factor, ECF subfamily n=1 Tax=Chitinophaga costaii TaxID=1335309 RepID=A0A1C4ELX8_9BACT|nr:RNA polymerase sigma factor [Chitinophaga costaii]SCC44567.1 RNA polymerase sigma-70 factor, ECF subfamily [Chitinophaga costaii]
MVQQAAEGHRDAFARLYTHYYPTLQAAINFITKNTDQTDEILQETFLRMWAAREKLVLVRSFESYAFRIARNFLYDLLRREKVHERALEALRAQENGIDHEDPLLHKEFYDIAATAIAQLDPLKRDIFLLRTQEAMPFAQIAEKMGLAVVTVKKHYYDTYHSLKTLISEHGGLFAFLFILWTRH